MLASETRAEADTRPAYIDSPHKVRPSDSLRLAVALSLVRRHRRSRSFEKRGAPNLTRGARTEHRFRPALGMLRAKDSGAPRDSWARRNCRAIDRPARCRVRAAVPPRPRTRSPRGARVQPLSRGGPPARWKWNVNFSRVRARASPVNLALFRPVSQNREAQCVDASLRAAGPVLANRVIAHAQQLRFRRRAFAGRRAKLLVYLCGAARGGLGL